MTLAFGVVDLAEFVDEHDRAKAVVVWCHYSRKEGEERVGGCGIVRVVPGSDIPGYEGAKATLDLAADIYEEHKTLCPSRAN